VATFSSILFNVLTAFLVVGSAAVWSVWISLMRQGRTLYPPRFRRGPHEVPVTAIGLTLLWLTVHLYQRLTIRPPAEFDADAMLEVAIDSAVSGLVVWGILLTVLIFSLRRYSDLVRFGFRCDEMPVQVHHGVTGFLAAFIPVYAVMFATYPLRSEETLHPLLRLLQEQGLRPEMIWVAIVAVVVAPLQEELLFRVVLQTWLERFLSGFGAVLVTAVLFSAVHGFPDSLGIFPLALVLGYVYRQRRSYLAVVLLHALFNAYNLWATVVFTFGTGDGEPQR
jgi:uncharacterized protein